MNFKKYCVCTVASDEYLEFLNYFTSSVIDKCKDLEFLYILFTGNDFPFCNQLYTNPKIRIIKYNQVIQTERLHDSGWAKNVDLKSLFVKDTFNKVNMPTFLIDADSFFISEFINEIDYSADVVVCKRKGNIPYIASFLGLINKENSNLFLNTWIENIKTTERIPRETKALVKTIEGLDKKIKIQNIDDTIISHTSYTKILPETKILHFKGSKIGDAKTLLSTRVNNLKKALNV